MLVLVGTKMLVNAAFDAKIIPTEVALLLTAALIGGSMLVSLVRTRQVPPAEASERALHGWVPGSPAEEGSGAKSPPRPDDTHDG